MQPDIGAPRPAPPLPTRVAFHSSYLLAFAPTEGASPTTPALTQRASVSHFVIFPNPPIARANGGPEQDGTLAQFRPQEIKRGQLLGYAARPKDVIDRMSGGQIACVLAIAAESALFVPAPCWNDMTPIVVKKGRREGAL
jgi:hypothetical protein